MMSYRSSLSFVPVGMIFHWKLRPLDFELFALKSQFSALFFSKRFAAFELIFGM